MLMNYCALLLFSLVAVHSQEPPVTPVGPFDKTEDNTTSPLGKDNSMFEGDIKYSEKLIGKAGSLNPWPNAVIPYCFDCSVENIPSAIAATKEAMKEWEAKTCIRFVEKRPGDTEYLEIFRSAGCWATRVGYRKGVKTQISIGNGCDYKHVMVHELGHVIGFWHEQSRPDRDNYIRINYANVLPALRYNFDKVSGQTNNYGHSYDYGSIMHYPWTAFSTNGQPTIVATRSLNGKKPYVKLSDVDASQVNVMYKCSSVRTQRGVQMTDMQNAAALVGRSTAVGFKCADTHASCALWAQNGHCSRAADPMLTLCAKSCDNCGPCVDNDNNCEYFQKLGHCRTRPEYMHRNCKVTCLICKPPPCINNNPNCHAWKMADYCRRRPDYMNVHCKKACGICKPVCVDKRIECKAWTEYGYCDHESFSTFMRKYCKKSCRKCATDIIVTPPTPKATTTTTKRSTTQRLTTQRLTTQSTTQSTTPFPTDKYITLPTAKFTGKRCVDRSKYCKVWQKNGRCNSDRWVMDNCLLSCRRFDICDIKEIVPIGRCASPLGLGWDNILPDRNFHSTSVFSPGGGWVARAFAARLYIEDNHTKKQVGAWCARPGSEKQYLQIDLGGLKTITAVATQGRDRYFEHVKSYSLSFSTDGRYWVKYKENGKKKTIFEGNCDHFTPVMNLVKKQPTARYIRFHPITFIGAQCMRVEVYGC